MAPLLLIHSLLDLLLRWSGEPHRVSDWVRTSRRLVTAVIVAVGLVVGMAWLVTEAPPSTYEIVACAEMPALGSKCVASGIH